MEPHLGSGAGQAIEDAYFVAALLGHRLTTLETIPRVFEIYNTLRRPFALDIARKSRQMGRYLNMNHKDFDIEACESSKQGELLAHMGDAMLETWEWTWTTTLDGMVEEGVRMLETVTP